VPLSLFAAECIECIRRLSLASVVGLADEDSTISPIVGVLLSLVFIAVFSEFRPFIAEDDCTLGIILSYSITLVSYEPSNCLLVLIDDLTFFLLNCSFCSDFSSCTANQDVSEQRFD